MITEKWTLLQPTYKEGMLFSPDYKWVNDSFYNLSRLFYARMYHINDADIEMDSDVYHVCNFDINLIEKEIEFCKKVKANGAKVLVGFSQDLRFLHGGELLSSQCTLYSELCEVADVITSGSNPNLGLYGRYQDKVVDIGEILEPLDFSIPYEDRYIDIMTSGSVGEQSLSFALEFLLMIKDKYPDKRAVCCIHRHHIELIQMLQKKYPQIEFPIILKLPTQLSQILQFLRLSKCYCNPEIRPRPARALSEAYYCRTPFISSDSTYLSRLCPDFTYNGNNIVQMFNNYERMLDTSSEDIIKKMEEQAQYDMFENAYKRLKEKLGL